MPADLVKDMLVIHGTFEEIKNEEMDKEMKKNTITKPNIPR